MGIRAHELGRWDCVAWATRPCVREVCGAERRPRAEAPVPRNPTGESPVPFEPLVSPEPHGTRTARANRIAWPYGPRCLALASVNKVEQLYPMPLGAVEGIASRPPARFDPYPWACMIQSGVTPRRSRKERRRLASGREQRERLSLPPPPTHTTVPTFPRGLSRDPLQTGEALPRPAAGRRRSLRERPSSSLFLLIPLPASSLLILIPIPNENDSLVGASLATPGLITVLQQRP
jgi:hypothetical protein